MVPAEECPQQPGQKQGDPVLTSLFALSLRGAPMHAPHSCIGAGAAADPKELPAVATCSHQHPGDRWQGGPGVDG